MSDTTCSACGKGRMATTHTKRRGGLLDRQRRCSACGFVDRVLVRPEVVLKNLPVKVRNHTLGRTQQALEWVEMVEAETLTQTERGQ